MSDPDQPRKGRFQPGNKFGKGRVRGSENKFGPGLREKLLAGIAASGEKKARKNGVNGKVDGTTYFIEALMENTAAASALLSKLIPPEPPPEKVVGPDVTILPVSVAEGQMFGPGQILMPYEMARDAFAAFNGGVETWKPYLEGIEGQMTLKSFEALCAVEPLERATLLQSDAPLLRLVPATEPSAPPLQKLEGPDARAALGAFLETVEPAELANMTLGELMRLAGVTDDA